MAESVDIPAQTHNAHTHAAPPAPAAGPILHGSLVTLRPLTHADAAQLVHILADERVRQFLRLEHAVSESDEHGFIDMLENTRAEQLVLGIEARVEGGEQKTCERCQA